VRQWEGELFLFWQIRFGALFLMINGCLRGPRCVRVRWRGRCRLYASVYAYCVSVDVRGLVSRSKATQIDFCIRHDQKLLPFLAVVSANDHFISTCHGLMAARVTRKDDGVCCSTNAANLNGIERGTEGHPRSTVEHGTAQFGRFVKIKALR
jgi:hypothetical protein